MLSIEPPFRLLFLLKSGSQLSRMLQNYDDYIHSTTLASLERDEDHEWRKEGENCWNLWWRVAVIFMLMMSQEWSRSWVNIRQIFKDSWRISRWEKPTPWHSRSWVDFMGWLHSWMMRSVSSSISHSQEVHWAEENREELDNLWSDLFCPGTIQFPWLQCLPADEDYEGEDGGRGKWEMERRRRPLGVYSFDQKDFSLPLVVLPFDQDDPAYAEYTTDWHLYSALGSPPRNMIALNSDKSIIHCVHY